MEVFNTNPGLFVPRIPKKKPNGTKTSQEIGRTSAMLKDFIQYLAMNFYKERKKKKNLK